MIPAPSILRTLLLAPLFVYLLSSCSRTTPMRNQEGGPQTSKEVRESEMEKTGPVSGKSAAFIAVNELPHALLPLAPQLGHVLLSGHCVVFETRGQRATILWPHGTTIDLAGAEVVVKLATGREFRVPSRTTLTGAHVPLNSPRMTKFTGRLHPDCPNDIFAVAAI